MLRAPVPPHPTLRSPGLRRCPLHPPPSIPTTPAGPSPPPRPRFAESLHGAYLAALEAPTTAAALDAALRLGDVGAAAAAVAAIVRDTAVFGAR